MTENIKGKKFQGDIVTDDEHAYLVLHQATCLLLSYRNDTIYSRWAER